MRWEIAALGIVALALLGGALAIFQPTTGSTVVQESAEQALETEPSTATLTPEEIDGILWMREEEKLARDVYLTLYEMWGLQVFKNIAASEQRHMNAMLRLIEAYGLEDPAQDQVGVFTNPELQELYNQLIEMGSRSVVDAILVGALIEETDIVDIQKWINVTDNPDVVQTYQNLMNGSANHLRAFSSQYERITGEQYQPQILSAETYLQLIGEASAGPTY